MKRIVVERLVNDEGLLQLSLPLGADEAGRAVRITIETNVPEAEMTPSQWQAAILATAGGWEGEFERPSPGALEEWEPLP